MRSTRSSGTARWWGRRPVRGSGDTWAVHALAGGAGFGDDCGLGALASGDTALLVAGDARRRYVLDGGGEVLLIRVSPLAGT